MTPREETPTVHSLLSQRAQSNSSVESRFDPYHLALVIEGGGMRGVVSGGMVSALEERGLLRCFDSIHGSSAGACAGAYFAAGQAQFGTRIYYEDVNSKKFIDVRRFLIGKPIMDAGFLIDHIMRVVKPLDVAKLVGRPGYLNVVTTDTQTGKAVMFDEFHGDDEFFLKLKASIYLPIIAGRWVNIGSLRLCDGGMSQQLALGSALGKSATHVLGLMTRKDDELIRPVNGDRVSVMERLLRIVYSRAFSRQYSRRTTLTNETIGHFKNKELIFEDGRVVEMDFICRPPGSIQVSRLTIDGAVLRQAAIDAREATMRFLDSP